MDVINPAEQLHLDLPADFDAAPNGHLDELCELARLWQSRRNIGQTPEGVKAGLLRLCAMVVQSQKTKRPRVAQ